MNIDTPWDNVELIDIIRWFGKSHHQTEESIQQAIQVLQNNWITSFKQYRQLEPTQRFSVSSLTHAIILINNYSKSG